MNRPLLNHLLFMALGYALAVLVATTVVVLIQGLPTVFPDQGAWGSFYNYLNDFPSMFLFGLLMTAIYGLPGWLITVVAAEWRGERGKYWFAIAGILTAILAIVIASRGQRLFADWLLNGGILVGGFFGGLAYWPMAGKTSANWKQTA